MKLNKRSVRWIAALAIVTIVAAQIPYSDMAAFAAGNYGVQGKSDFLGINGLTNETAAETAVAGVSIFGIVAATQGGGSAGAGASVGGASTNPPTVPASVPSPSPSPTTSTISPLKQKAVPVFTTDFDAPLTSASAPVSHP